MTAAESPPAPAAPSPRAESDAHRPPVASCPFLVSADGSWRGATPTRDHRCGAVAPPAPLATDKQRRLCLTAAHEACATYLAARATADALPGRAAGLPRPLTRMTPVVLDHGRVRVSMPAFRGDRSTGQLVLVAILLVAFLAVVLAGLSGAGRSGGAGDFDRSASPAATQSVGPSAAATPGTSAPAVPSPSIDATPDGSRSSDPAPPSPSPDSGASPTAAPSRSAAARTYTVKAGDTLIGIATRFGTTTTVLIRLNDLKNPSSLRIGQVLVLP